MLFFFCERVCLVGFLFCFVVVCLIDCLGVLLLVVLVWFEVFISDYNILSICSDLFLEIM